MSVAGFDVTTITAPLLFGMLFDAVLLGLATNQAYLYFVAFPRDHPAIKAVVAALYSIELAQTVLLMRDAYRWFARDLADLNQLNDIQLSWMGMVVMTGVVGCMVQLFFVYRIWVLAGRRVWARMICACIALISFTQCAAALASVARVAKSGAFSKAHSNAFVTAVLWLSGSATCDVIIAITMTICLLKKQTAFKETNMLISRLITMTVETGTVTATVAIADVALFLVFPEGIFYAVPSAMLGKLYTTTFMAILNSRMHIRGGRNDVPTSSNGLSLSSNSQGSGRPRVVFPVRKNTLSSTDRSQSSFDSVRREPYEKLPGTFQLVPVTDIERNFDSPFGPLPRVDLDKPLGTIPGVSDITHTV